PPLPQRQHLRDHLREDRLRVVDQEGHAQGTEGPDPGGVAQEAPGGQEVVGRIVLPAAPMSGTARAPRALVLGLGLLAGGCSSTSQARAPAPDVVRAVRAPAAAAPSADVDRLRAAAVAAIAKASAARLSEV